MISIIFYNERKINLKKDIVFIRKYIILDFEEIKDNLVYFFNL